MCVCVCVCVYVCVCVCVCERERERETWRALLLDPRRDQRPARCFRNAITLPTCSKVDEFVRRTQDVNFRIVQQHACVCVCV